MTYNMLSTARAVRHNHIRSTSFRVIRMQSLVVDSCNSHGVDAVRVSVEVALVSLSSSITTCEDEHRALSASSVQNTVNYRLLNQVTRAFHRLAVVCGAPTAAVY